MSAELMDGAPVIWSDEGPRALPSDASGEATVDPRAAVSATGAPASIPSLKYSEFPSIPGFAPSEKAESAGGARQHARWSPYDLNGGTALAIAGEDFVVIAADTRLSTGYSILSRDVPKHVKLTEDCVLATGGCWTDVSTLHKTLVMRVDEYLHRHETNMGCESVAQMLSNILYSRRFFPYYAFNVLAGIDKEGKGAVFTYDAVGSFERVAYACQGNGQKLIIPLLDNIVGFRTRMDEKPVMTKERAIRIVKEAFVTAGERDIYTGDRLIISTVTKTGVEEESFDLKAD